MRHPTGYDQPSVDFRKAPAVPRLQPLAAPECHGPSLGTRTSSLGGQTPTLPSGGCSRAGRGRETRGAKAGRRKPGRGGRALSRGRELPAWRLRHLSPLRKRHQRSQAPQLGYVRQLKI